MHTKDKLLFLSFLQMQTIDAVIDFFKFTDIKEPWMIGRGTKD